MRELHDIQPNIQGPTISTNFNSPIVVLAQVNLKLTRSPLFPSTFFLPSPDQNPDFSYQNKQRHQILPTFQQKRSLDYCKVLPHLQKNDISKINPVMPLSPPFILRTECHADAIMSSNYCKNQFARYASAAFRVSFCSDPIIRPGKFFSSFVFSPFSFPSFLLINIWKPTL